MPIVDPELKISELLRIAADFGQERISLSDEERQLLISCLKTRAQEELDYGEEVEFESVRIVRRVTGAVGVYFKS